jgi:hypothetical protein
MNFGWLRFFETILSLRRIEKRGNAPEVSMRIMFISRDLLQPGRAGCEGYV